MVNKYPHTVVARIDEYIEPIDRGDRYEDPLAKVLEKSELGEVTGGGSQLDDEYKIAFVEIELQLANLDEALSLTKQTLNQLGAPIGSQLEFERDGKLCNEPIGNLECLGIYLDGVGLPNDVYANLDFSAVLEQLHLELKTASAGEPRGIRQGNEETGVFVFGPSADKIYSVVQSLPAKIPIFQNARIVFKRKDQSKQPKEIRLPLSN
jgi:hypothetical protein